jgi:hypothetical protein
MKRGNEINSLKMKIIEALLWVCLVRDSSIMLSNMVLAFTKDSFMETKSAVKYCERMRNLRGARRKAPLF